jgi:oxygen-independent coproporphyrinogen-3 oxidase
MTNKLKKSNNNSKRIQKLLGVEECVRYYPPNIEKIKNSEAIFRNDRDIDIYLHIPFCKTPCGFCPFNQYLYKEDEVKSYLSSVEKEIKILGSLYSLDQLKIKTFWIGGGTPSDLSEENLERILKIINKNFDLSCVEEFTIEAKPILKLFTDKKINLLRKYKVTRVSLGVQSINQKYLKILGRAYESKDAIEMIKRIKNNGFILNIDMIYRLPGQTLTEVAEDVNQVKTLGIDHISWFPYISHQGTPIEEKMDREKRLKKADREQYFEMFNEIIKIMNREGYEQYTPYYFSKKIKCQYHIGRWQMPQRDTLGIGAGAFSFFNGWIYANAHNTKVYQDAVNNNKAPIVMGRKLNQIEKNTRLAVLGIKFFTINFSEFEKYSGIKMNIYYQKELGILKKLGLIKVYKDRIECTRLGKAFNNDIATYFSVNSARQVNQPQAINLIDKGL